MTGFEPPTLKIVDLSGIRTRIVGVEDEHADHLTTTTAQQTYFLLQEVSNLMTLPF